MVWSTAISIFAVVSGPSRGAVVVCFRVVTFVVRARALASWRFGARARTLATTGRVASGARLLLQVIGKPDLLVADLLEDGLHAHVFVTLEGLPQHCIGDGRCLFVADLSVASSTGLPDGLVPQGAHREGRGVAGLAELVEKLPDLLVLVHVLVPLEIVLLSLEHESPVVQIAAQQHPEFLEVLLVALLLVVRVVLVDEKHEEVED